MRRPPAASPGSPRGVALLLAAPLIGLLAQPAAGQGSKSFYCIVDIDNPPIQPFVVPQGVSELQVLVQGAHGGNPDHGASGGFGGSVQATFAVGPQGSLKPGQQLDVWVGCYGDIPQGYGFGGDKGVANFAYANDGATGGGGSAVVDHASGAELVVAGGGGGGGGEGFVSGGGAGGNGGPDPQPGQDGDRYQGDRGGTGGCVNCLDVGDTNGLDGGGSSTFSAGGGGGGGGGGYTGGGRGTGGNYAGTGGGGGGAGSSFVVASATSVGQATSNLAQGGTVVFLWGGAILDADKDGVPDAHDRCRRSDLTPTLRLGRCETRALNALDVDGCTVADRIARIAKNAETREQLVRRVARLWRDLDERGSFTPAEKRAIRRCAARASVAEVYR